MDKKEKIKKMEEALKRAKRIIDCCGGGDDWQRECNEQDMDIFYKICSDLEIN